MSEKRSNIKDNKTVLSYSMFIVNLIVSILWVANYLYFYFEESLGMLIFFYTSGFAFFAFLIFNIILVTIQLIKKSLHKKVIVSLTIQLTILLAFIVFAKEIPIFRYQLYLTVNYNTYMNGVKEISKKKFEPNSMYDYAGMVSTSVTYGEIQAYKTEENSLVIEFWVTCENVRPFYLYSSNGKIPYGMEDAHQLNRNWFLIGTP